MARSGLAITRFRIPKAAFQGYLRTGLLLLPDEVEVKFNPWHDPETGRFTSGGNGTWGGGGFTGGGGGSAGGGGASGSWDGPVGKPQGHGPSATSAKPAMSTLSAPVSVAASNDPWHSVTSNGYVYRIDGEDRTRQVTGTLVLNPDQTRSRAAQASAGGADRLSTDDGGHYIARRFDGPTDDFNHFAQDANFNRGAYKVLENQWAKDTKDGQKVYVTITPIYPGSSTRPRHIDVRYTTNGTPGFRTFSNAPKRKPNGKR